MKHKRIAMVLMIMALQTILLPMTLQAQETPAVPAIVQQTADGAAAELEKAGEAVKAEAAEAAEAAESEEAAPTSHMANTFWSLVPPLVAILLALITKEVYSSLFIGILLGALFNANFYPIETINLITNDGIGKAVSETAGIFIFLVILGILVALINRTGATAAFGNWAKTHVKSRIGAILATFLLGILIFIDDYFNCLTVGSVMLPVTDSKRVSRAKLAYIIDATAAPICMIAPISSWAAAVAEFSGGTGYNGLELFIKSIPYNFYSLLTFVFIIAITLLKLDYGPMARHERNAIEKGDLFTEGGEQDEAEQPLKNAKGRVWDLLVPVIILIVVSVFALVHIGGWPGSDFITAFSETDATVALPWGGIIVLFLTVLYLFIRRIIPFKEAMQCIPKGFIAMVPALLILTMAIALKNMTVALGSKVFIKNWMEAHASGLNQLLPAVIFIIACFISFATGTSWGTFGILIPIVCNIFPADNPLMYIGMSACLAGSVCGDHCSPISDTTIMSSAGARCMHVNHVSTQLPYAITVAAISFVGFVLAGYITNWFVVFPITVILMIATLFIIKKLCNAEKQIGM